jgi:hypothetical protein
MRVSCWLRHASLLGSGVAFLNSEDLERLQSAWRTRTVAEKQDALLLALAKLSRHPGYEVPIFHEFDHVLAWCELEEEFDYHVDALRAREFANSASMDDGLIVTPGGWSRIDELRAVSPESSDLVFVAMTFKTELNSAWINGLKPGIEASGYRPERVDTAEHAGKIDDRIMAMIRESRFIVVDVTTQNTGAYFEAGFALGLGRQVIWSVQEDDLKYVHFDTRQFNHVVWRDPADLKTKIRDRVLGVFGRGPAG